MRCTSVSTAASPTTTIARPPSALTIAVVSSTSSRDRAAQTTAAPSRANTRLSTRPTPLLAPVMRATFPSSCPIEFVVRCPAKRLDELREGHHLPAARRRRHHDERPHAGRRPRLDARSNVLHAAEERDVAQPPAGHQLGNPLHLAPRERNPDGQHLLLVARLDPEVLVLRQAHNAHEGLSHP